jgi:hypothetical protein
VSSDPTVVLRRTGQFIDEDAPADISAAIGSWWTGIAPAQA